MIIKIFSKGFFALLITDIIFFVSPALSEDVVSILSNHPKIHNPAMILNDFLEGKPETRIIVNLKEPAQYSDIEHIRKLTDRNKLKKAVKETLDNVLYILDQNNIHITNQFTFIYGFAAKVTPEGLKQLLSMDEVYLIEKDIVIEPHLAQGIPLINASTVRSTYDGRGIGICITDTGIDYTHPQLGNGGLPNSKVVGGYDTGQNDDDPIDQNGHGTACSGIAAGYTAMVGDYIGGMAPGAKLYALKITDTATGGSAYESDLIEAWEWCLNHQYDDPGYPIMVINTSFGGLMYTSVCDADFPASTNATANIVSAGITIFASSGNDGYCNAISWPACISHVISVGAVYDDNIGGTGWCVKKESCAGSAYPGCYPDQTACWDNLTSGNMVTCYSNTSETLDIFSPSNNTYTTDISGTGGYNSSDYVSGFGGTSAASPYAAGAAALLQQSAKAITGCFLNPTEVKNKLVTTGDAVTDPKSSITKPRINLANAVNSIVESFEYVEPFGSCGGNMPCFSTVQHGIDSTPGCETIRLADADYNENIVMWENKVVNMEGGWNNTFTIRGYPALVIGNNSTGTEINSLTIENGTTIIK